MFIWKLKQRLILYLGSLVTISISPIFFVRPLFALLPNPNGVKVVSIQEKRKAQKMAEKEEAANRAINELKASENATKSPQFSTTPTKIINVTPTDKSFGFSLEKH